MDIPESRRPGLSGYIQGHKQLPWKWVDARMAGAKNYWITTHARGYPSSRPVWGIWQSPVLWFSNGSQVAKNFARDPRVQVNLESADELVIVEGRVEPMTELSDARIWAEAYKQKYNWDMPVSTDSVFRVVPARVLAWICDSSGLDDGAGFSNSATEWTFPTS